jgi:AraC-like DNA-binding protein
MPAKKNKTVHTTVTTNLSPATVAVLQLLHPTDPSTVADLAERAGVSRSTVSKALAALDEGRCARRESGGHEGARRTPDQWFAISVTAPAKPAAASTDTPTPDAEPAPIPTKPAPKTSAEPAPAAQAETVDEPAPRTDPAPTPAETGAKTSTNPAPAAAAETVDEPGPGADPAAQPAPVPGSAGGGARLGKGELRAQVEEHLRAHPEREWTPGQIAKVLKRSAGAIHNACQKLVSDNVAQTFLNAPTRFQIILDE